MDGEKNVKFAYKVKWRRTGGTGSITFAANSTFASTSPFATPLLGVDLKKTVAGAKVGVIGDFRSVSA